MLAADPEPEVQHWLGGEFVCVARAGEHGFDIEEYLPRGETFACWGQRVTVRRARPSPAFDADGFLMRLRAEFSRDPDLRLEDGGVAAGGHVLLLDKAGKGPEGRLRSCLLILYSPESGLVLLQYAQQTGHLDEALADLQFKAWYERLLAQAQGAGGAGAAAGVEAAGQASNHHG